MSINIKKSHRGRFTAYKKRTGKTTEEALHSKNAHVRAMARFAKAARKWKHEDGGLLPVLLNGGYGDPTSMANLGYSFAQINNLPQKNLLPSGLAPTNNPGGGGGSSLSMGLNPIGIELSALTAVGGALGGNMAMERAELYENATERMRPVDVNKATQGAGLQAFLQNPLSFGIGGRKKARIEAREFNENMEKERFNRDVKSRFSTLSEAPTYAPVARQGGFIAYKGETHDGPSGGILVDKMGNPTSLSNNEATALVEGGGKNKKGEVARYEPGTGSTYIYSDSLGFAGPATHLLNKYKLDKPNSLLYKQYKNDVLLNTAVDKQFDNLTAASEFAKETNTSFKDTMNILPQAGKGGYLSASKAKEMLRDGMAHGKKLTARQKRYFGWVAGGKKEEGGLLESFSPSLVNDNPNKRTVLLPRENLEYDKNLKINQGWTQPLKKAKNLDELYNTEIGTWQGNPLSLKQFSEMPEYATSYYNPNYAIEFNKNRLGLPNTFQDINMSAPRRNEGYTPSSNYKPDNLVAYYGGGGYVRKRKKAPPPFLPEVSAPIGAYQWGGKTEDYVTRDNPLLDYYNQDKAKRSVYPGMLGSINPDPFVTKETLKRVEDWKKARANYKPTTPFEDISKDFNMYWGEPAPVLFNRTDAQYKNKSSKKEDWIYTGSPTLPGPKRSSTSVGKAKPTPIAREKPLTRPNISFLKAPVLNPREQQLSTSWGNPLLALRDSLNRPESDLADNPWLNPAGHLLSGTGALADYAALRGAKPTPLSLQRVGAERISLAKQRIANQRNADTAMAMNATMARSASPNAGAYMSRTTGANTGVNRLLGQQNAELLEREENANAQMQMQANMVNAELAAQEGLFNTQRLDAYNMLKARINPWGGLARNAASYFADNAAYGLGYDTLRMANPNAELYYEPDAGIIKRTLGRPRIRFKDIEPKVASKKKTETE